MSPERAQVIKWTAIIVTIVLLIVILSGCTSRSASASYEHRQGMDRGEPTDLHIERREKSESQAGPELAGLVQAAVKTANGDLLGAISALAARPAAPSADDLAALVRKEVSAAADGAGVNPTTGTAIGAAAGAALLYAQQLLAARARRREQEEREAELRKDRDEGWQKAHDNALKVPVKDGGA